jgi:hypothetical protein
VVGVYYGVVEWSTARMYLSALPFLFL